MPWWSGFEPIVRTDAALADLTWYQLGGPARWLVAPRDAAELARVMSAIRGAGVAWRVLGKGANVLVRDGGFDGAVIVLSAESWSGVEFDFANHAVEAGAGIDFNKLSKKVLARGLGGLERLAGIPGSFGGIIRMNAGGKYGSISEFVEWVRVLTPTGEIVDRPAAAVGFSYRHTQLDDHIVLAARCRFSPEPREALEARNREIWNEKYATQPAVSQRSSGCIFKNPPNEKAGRLIDEAGLKGVRVGGAEISQRHANFIVAGAGTTAQNVLDLIAIAQDRVRERTGISLELEVEVW